MCCHGFPSQGTFNNTQAQKKKKKERKEATSVNLKVTRMYRNFKKENKKPKLNQFFVCVRLCYQRPLGLSEPRRFCYKVSTTNIIPGKGILCFRLCQMFSSSGYLCIKVIWRRQQLRSSNLFAWQYACVLSCYVHVFAIPWSVAYQAPLSMGFSWQEILKWIVISSPGDLLDPGIKPMSPVSPALAGRFFTIEPPGNPLLCTNAMFIWQPFFLILIFWSGFTFWKIMYSDKDCGILRISFYCGIFF